MCRLKNPTVAFILQNLCVQCTPAHYPREIFRIGTLTGDPLCRESHALCRLEDPTIRLLIVLERGCSSMYRKKERLDKAYAKEPLLAFLKAFLVNYYG